MSSTKVKTREVDLEDDSNRLANQLSTRNRKRLEKVRAFECLRLVGNTTQHFAAPAKHVHHACADQHAQLRSAKPGSAKTRGCSQALSGDVARTTFFAAKAPPKRQRQRSSVRTRRAKTRGSSRAAGGGRRVLNLKREPPPFDSKTQWSTRTAARSAKLRRHGVPSASASPRGRPVQRQQTRQFQKYLKRTQSAQHSETKACVDVCGKKQKDGGAVRSVACVGESRRTEGGRALLTRQSAGEGAGGCVQRSLCGQSAGRRGKRAAPAAVSSTWQHLLWSTIINHQIKGACHA